MADRLIEHLKLRGAEHSALQALVNQWGFDEKLIPKALQSIGVWFPHFSRHDESHSRQILVTIERLLGPGIKLLSATDTWLLLEAAYWHDIGMVVPHEDLGEAIKSQEFQSFLDAIRLDSQHEQHDFACKWKANGKVDFFSSNLSPIETVDNFRNLMAEWFRRQHANRSAAIVQNPWEASGISSPRTELIPDRLFRLLGRICQMHGSNFENILSPTGLPYKEAGIAQDDCHPRFIACLLRMGDLLDLDGNRFCPVMQKIAGNDRSPTSKAHEDKHSAIRHLRIDRARIEIKAECLTIEGYLATFDWFDWLKSEIQNQMTRWLDIVPDRELGLLPTLGELTVSLQGDYEILDAGKRPQFLLDGPRAIQLLQGNNLYSDEFACIRELLQNAVDATLLRIWLNKAEVADDWNSPFTSTVKELFTQFPITVALVEQQPTPDLPESKSLWTLTITDIGTGISKLDLSHMSKIGGSPNNSSRQEKIARMPEWMKPSGAFGIGLQSTFLICNELELSTKSIVTNEVLQISMHSPLGEKKGLILVKTLTADHAHEFGTKISIRFMLEKFATGFSTIREHNSSIAWKFASTLDPILHDRFPYEAAELADRINQFGNNSMLPIRGLLKTLDSDEEIVLGQAQTRDPALVNEWELVKIDDEILALRFEATTKFNSTMRVFYRGQEVKGDKRLFGYANIEVNILSGKAGRWLTAARDQLVTGASEQLEKLLKKALKDLLLRNLEQVNFDLLQPRKKIAISLFTELMAHRFGECWNDMVFKSKEEWLNIPSHSGDTLRSYLTKSKLVIADGYFDSSEIAPGIDLKIGNEYGGFPIRLFINKWIDKNGGSVQLVRTATTDRWGIEYLLDVEQQPPFSNDYLAHKMRELLERKGNRRYLLPCFGKFNVLGLKEEGLIHAGKILPRFKKNKTPLLLLPFMFTSFTKSQKANVQAKEQQLIDLCKWVQPRLAEEISIEEIHKLYLDLVEHIDQRVMMQSEFKKEWEEARQQNKSEPMPAMDQTLQQDI
ncbi:MAG: hypothetical protein WC714_09600 [Candidatus Obscuribacterales bacterium]